MSLEFNVLATTAAGGRRGRMHLPHRTVETPVFMPVGTAGTVKAVSQDVLEALGAEIILGNTYHLYLRPGHEAIRRMGGLHRFIELAAGAADRLRRLSGLQPERAAQGQRRGRAASARIWTAAATSLLRNIPWMCRSRWARTSAWPSTSAPNIPPSAAAPKRACG